MAKGFVVIDVDRCKGCGLCTNVCPANILVLSRDAFNAKGYHPVVVTDVEKCIGCASCARICPDVVFTVYRQKRQTQRAQVSAVASAAPVPVI
ncbi:MAG: 4Fe-4S dicluster domain-containing protein [Anaerolineae bacterium]